MAEHVIEDLKSQSLKEDVKIDQQVDIEALIAERIEAAGLTFKKEIAGLNRKNSELELENRTKGKTNQTVEERLQQMESERAHDQLAHAELEAFTEAKIDSDWLKPFHTSDPFERATLMKGLLAAHEQTILENMSKTFGTRLPTKTHKLADKSKFTVDELAGLSTDEINRLWDEGKVVGT